jgi:phage baseplate assembly protein W
MKQMGRDLRLFYAGPGGTWEDADVVAARGRTRAKDLAVAVEIDAATQMLVNRLKTQKGELSSLGHPEYGSRHHELIGEPNVERTRNLIKLYVLEAMSHEPRIEKIESCEVFAPHDPPRSQVNIEMEIRLIDQPRPINLIVPFYLEAE